MVNVIRYLHESHLILCKLIYTKIEMKGISKSKNKWIVRLEHIVYKNFDTNIDDKNHPG